jgi:YD repeat-containing protein
VAGTLSEPATVTIEGQPATVTATDDFSGTVPVSSGTSTFSVSARDASGNVQTDEFEVENAGSSQTLTYDANGNLIADGTRTFEWDARNQLGSARK